MIHLHYLYIFAYYDMSAVSAALMNLRRITIPIHSLLTAIMLPRGLLTASIEGFRSCLCPRCLRTMPLRRTRPRASIYSGGVRCDYCRIELMGDANEGDGEEDDGQESQGSGFCHCSRCWFDLCRQCAYKEMQEVWWGED